MADERSIMDVLLTIPDPEMPISIVDLGLIENIVIDEREVAITVLPTFVGCPALAMIEDSIKSKVLELVGVDRVKVRFINDPPWTVDRISDAGRESLREFGVSVPSCGGTGVAGSGAETALAHTELRTSAVACPFCDSDSTRLESPFGPTRCRMIFYCESCRNNFERMKRV